MVLIKYIEDFQCTIVACVDDQVRVFWQENIYLVHDSKQAEYEPMVQRAMQCLTSTGSGEMSLLRSLSVHLACQYVLLIPWLRQKAEKPKLYGTDVFVPAKFVEPIPGYDPQSPIYAACNDIGWFDDQRVSVARGHADASVRTYRPSSGGCPTRPERKPQPERGLSPG